jgi:hypothetical protein
VNTWTSIEPLSVTVEAGGAADAVLRIRNTGDIVEEYHVDVVGDPALWCTAEPATLRLYPGTTESVRLRFTPPRGPDPAAGPHPYGVRIRPVEAPDAVTVPEGNVSVVPFSDVRAELLPVIVRGWRRARPRLAVDNYGNTTVTAAVQAAVQDNSVDFEMRNPSFQIPPGRAYFSDLTGRPTRLRWLGHKVSHPFTATVTPSGGKVAKVPGTYVQTALLPSWMSRLLMGLLALAMVFAALWFYAKPSLKSEATALAEPPSVGVTQSAAPGSLSGSASAAASPAKSKSKPASGSGAGSGASAQSGSGSGTQSSSGSGAQPDNPPAQSQPANVPAVPNPPHKAAPASVSVPQPVSFWQMNNGVNTPATTAVDTEGRHPAKGTGGAEWCTGRGCVYLNGSNSALQTSGPVLNTAPGKSFTVAAWVWLQYIPSNQYFATAVSQSASNDSSFFLQYSGTDKCWAFTRPVANANPIGSVVRALGCTGNYTQQWTYLTGVFNASDNQLSIYVNGREAGAAKTDPTPFASGGPLYIGRAMDNGGQEIDWWPGCLKDIKVFSSALSGQQVSLLYSNDSQ